MFFISNPISNLVQESILSILPLMTGKHADEFRVPSVKQAWVSLNFVRLSRPALSSQPAEPV
jgi:hypothetical protein